MDVISIEQTVKSAIARFLAKEIDRKELSDLMTPYADAEILDFLNKSGRSDLVSVIDQAADMDFLEQEGDPEIAMRTFEEFSRR